MNPDASAFIRAHLLRPVFGTFPAAPVRRILRDNGNVVALGRPALKHHGDMVDLLHRPQIMGVRGVRDLGIEGFPVSAGVAVK